MRHLHRRLLVLVVTMAPFVTAMGPPGCAVVGVETVLHLEGTVRVRTDPGAGQGIRGAIVQLSAAGAGKIAEARTDSLGRFGLRVVHACVPGELSLEAGAPGYRSMATTNIQCDGAVQVVNLQLERR